MALWRAGAASTTLFNTFVRPSYLFTASRHLSTDVADGSLRNSMKNQLLHVDINSLIGSCMPLSSMRIGTIIHNIEVNPGQGAKLVRAAGTCAKILKEPSSTKCLVMLPSGAEKWIDSQCRATIGTVSNASHGTKKLRKAGQSRWLGRRPVVRGVAMNPVDHPHGGGEGRSKSSGAWGKGSRTPWGKPTKSGFKTGPLKRRK
ncbi:large ribosomal subunit protein uL2m isoform X1 [Ziziphus jujuba]|uniref:Large ribosomal subunit protein uL2m isoform X1 n=1 Tax=Ziziphus jujuba TaxID=326968 RepID=A0A6P4AF18_ZIZJJ|nr:large ribosomal subunit protein uL2m isoform X1 [Ziziphus jujuba]XP_015893129.3 large ribosomal subunit protein uL2m isoform X1 [Ziziphus jujuba]XP_015893131.3 large ribosomal subunit protein uL2m isoform X1 [Ziziphus jujuba]XP_024933551.3 large ribosomal subunit protein uL2m isoform X1 [Ziziphus jujuba]XP_048337463.2 large ribosomal subunit protein uL2m isoform X1 [Ziziphus jujuba]XP_060667495.1 large ribosomal subunit protein uL2m isoform X1 [Ziziphus jujuba]XP_060667496.1 large ribosoma